MNDTNMISKQIEEYISYKQALGFQLIIESQELRRFAKYTRELDFNGSLTADLAIQWASLNSNYSRWYMSRRLETVYTFAKYAALIDYTTQIPPKGIYGKCHGRTTPFIFTEKEIEHLMIKARSLQSPDKLRATTVEYAIGLIWTTGLRPSELCHLTINDVNFRDGLIYVRKTKFNKKRVLPIHNTALTALKEYSKIRDTLCFPSTLESFFRTTSGRELKLRDLEYAMQLLRTSVLNQRKRKWAGRKPRLYDIRHSFVCNVIIRWLQEGRDVNHEMVYLSAYLGHVKPSDTYWYLTGVPELMNVASKAFEEFFEASDINVK